MNKLLDALLWLDIQVFRLITFGNCRKGETISAASWSLYLDGKWQGRIAVPVIDWLFSPWQTQHCRNAWLWQAEIYQG